MTRHLRVGCQPHCAAISLGFLRGQKRYVGTGACTSRMDTQLGGDQPGQQVAAASEAGASVAVDTTPAAADKIGGGRLPGDKRTVALHLAYVGTTFRGARGLAPLLQACPWLCTAKMRCYATQLVTCQHTCPALQIHPHLVHAGLQLSRELPAETTVEGVLELALLKVSQSATRPMAVLALFLSIAHG